MKKIIAYILLISMVSFIALDGFITEKHTYFLENSGLSKKKREILRHVLITIDEATMYQKIQAACKAADDLQKIIDSKKKVLLNAYEEDQGPISLAIEIVELQRAHFKDFARIETHHLPYFQCIKGWINAVWDSITTSMQWYGNKKITVIQNLTNQLLIYTALERCECLQTYSQAMHYFVFQKHIKLPEVVNFWAYKPMRFALTQQIKKFTSIPKIQASIVGDLAEVVGEALADGAGNVLKSTVKSGGSIIENASGNILKETLPDGSSVELAADSTGALKPLPGAVSAELAEIAAEQVGIRSVSGVASKFDSSFSNLSEVEDTISALKNDTAAMNAVDELTGISRSADVSDVLSDAAKEGVVSDLEGLEPMIEPLSEDTAMTFDEYVADLGEKFKNDGAKYQGMYKELAAQTRKIRKGDDGWLTKKRLLTNINHSKEKLDSTIKSQVKEMNALAKKLPKKDPRTIEINNQIKALKKSKEGVLDTLTSKGKEISIEKELNKAKSWDTAAVWADRTKTAADMMLQMGIMQGSSLAISWIDAADAQTFADIKAKETKVQVDFQVKINQIQAASQAQIQLSEQAASWRLNILAAKQADITSLFTDQQTYFLQTLISASVATNYISNPMVWDQYFLYAPMYTPSAIVQPSPNKKNPIIYFPPSPVYYSTPWSVPPLLSTKSLADTYLWKFLNGKLTIAAIAPSGLPIIPPSSLPKISQTIPSYPVDHTWYNVGRCGNWEYSATDNSFYQYSMIPSATPQLPQGDSSQAGLNSIFTEYIPPTINDVTGVRTYQIQAEVQISSGQSPWVAGIIFNQARWISGVTDQMNQYRFCGLYSSSKSSPITFCAAESLFMTSTIATQSALSPITPLHQIMGTVSEKALWSTANKNLISNPLYPTAGTSTQTPLALGTTYVITIFTQPETIFVILSIKNTDGSLTNVFGPAVLAGRNPIVWHGHSIGFVSSGCSARFSLNKPQELVYTASDIARFTKQLSSGT